MVFLKQHETLLDFQGKNPTSRTVFSPNLGIKQGLPLTDVNQIFNLMSRVKFECQDQGLKQLRELGEVVSVTRTINL